MSALNLLFSIITIYHSIVSTQSHSLTDLTLIDDPAMPIDGKDFSVYVNETSKEIWLFSLDNKIISMYIHIVI